MRPDLVFITEIAVGQLFFAQDRKCVVDQESRRVEHDQNFREQRLDQRLARFLRDAPRDVGLTREQNLLKTPQHSNAIADAPAHATPVARRARARPQRALRSGPALSSSPSTSPVAGFTEAMRETANSTLVAICEEVYAGRNGAPEPVVLHDLSS